MTGQALGMGVTTYYSAGEEEIGERSGGVRTDYLRNALGSVTATKRTDRGTISNTYHYKPYGERLAKTGVAAGPRFQWVGTAGYRETAISHSKSYVRARHLGQEEGRWTTVDPLWPENRSMAFNGDWIALGWMAGKGKKDGVQELLPIDHRTSNVTNFVAIASLRKKTTECSVKWPGRSQSSNEEFFEVTTRSLAAYPMSADFLFGFGRRLWRVS